MLTRKQFNALAAFVAREHSEDRRVADAWALREIAEDANPNFDLIKWAKGCNIPVCCGEMVTAGMGIVFCEKCKTSYCEVPKHRSGIGGLHWVKEEA